MNQSLSYDCHTDAQLLHQIANAMTHSRFLPMFNSNQTRFGERAALLNKVRFDVLLRWVSALPYDYLQDRRRAEIPPEVAISGAAEQLRIFANQLATVPVSKRKFAIPRGQSWTGAFTTIRQALPELRRRILRLGDPSSPVFNIRLKTGDVTEVLYGIFVLSESVDTLQVPTAHSRFEMLLAKLLDGSDEYFRRGYPFDLLVHDKLDLQTEPSQVEAIYYPDDYIASELVRKGHPAYIGYRNQMAMN
ncbi:hypothetical protein IC617_08415 [Neiella sp. HB171785]|uniref:Uncharacterized protein n=1 Tax=Neiella litorisoli TaxID=2771431 RepID=A0A8J6UIY4_9GAMM|nr:hypothetical protein [Neiella litorisoli]MBD1389448.1 hypothetical protein [Neiella litorisoli]